MADINLLQNANVPSNSHQGLFRSLSAAGMVLLFVSIGLFALFYFLDISTEARLSDATEKKNSIEQKIKEQEGYKPLVVNQTKAKNLEVLLDDHLNWSEVLPQFAKSTLNNAKYTKFLANQDGGATITGTVSDFQNLSKLMKAFQLGEDRYIQDVKLTSVALGSEGSNDITYTVKVTFNKESLKTKKVNQN